MELVVFESFKVLGLVSAAVFIQIVVLNISDHRVIDCAFEI